MLPLNRESRIEVADADAKGVVIRCLPLDTPTVVSDGGPTYREVWRPGAFDGLRPQKTVLQRTHQEAAGANVFGIGREIGEQDGHVQAYFEYMDEAPIAGLARRLIDEGTWEFASVSVIMRKDGTRTGPDGVVERTKVADFRHLALVDQPAYRAAAVVATRASIAEAVAYLERMRTLIVKRPR